MGTTQAALLGVPFVVMGAGVEERLLPERRGQLLAHLAYKGEWVPRDRIAYLFWPDHGEDAARRNLRKLLYKTRDLPWLEGFEVDRHAVRWQPGTDVSRFERALYEGDVAAAGDLYRGQLLDGFDDAGGEYDSWLFVERSRLHERWRLAVIAAAERAGSDADLDGDAARRAHTLLTRLLQLDPLDEYAVVLALGFARRSGRSTEALGLYRRFRQAVDDELGLEPGAELARLAAALAGESDIRSVRVASPARRPSLPTRAAPTAGTSFVGRERELTELAALLGEPTTRLVSLVGMGGTGKSRLASELGTRLEAGYGDGAVVVALDAVRDPMGVEAAIAQAVGADLAGVGAPVESLVSSLRDRHMLLVLDGFERLLPADDVVPRLVHECPGVTVLVTSRERLRLGDEVVYAVGGLPVPPVDDAAETVDALAEYEASLLFLDRARRVRPDVGARAGDVGAIAAVCRLLGGSPLGIELAAAWTRVLNPAELESELRTSLDMLNAPADAPARHRSLRAVFDHSWELLSTTERRSLARLAVFSGGFDRAAAKLVADTPLLVLAALVDKSLVTVDASGRFFQHPLVHGYSAEKLAASPAELAAASENHERYYLQVVDRIGADILRGGQRDALALLETDHENVVAAWRWAMGAGRVADIAHFALLMMLFYDAKGRYAEGAALLEASAVALDAGASPDVSPDAAATRAFVLVELAWLRFRLSDYASAVEAATEGVALARAWRKPVYSAWLLGGVAMYTASTSCECNTSSASVVQRGTSWRSA